MTPIPLTPQIIALTRRLVWFEPPEVALAEPVRFLAYAFARASHEDMTLLRQFLTSDDLLEALDHAPPGIIDPRSWAYRNNVMGRYPAPDMPKRRLALRDLPSQMAAGLAIKWQNKSTAGSGHKQ